MSLLLKDTAYIQNLNVLTVHGKPPTTITIFIPACAETCCLSNPGVAPFNSSSQYIVFATYNLISSPVTIKLQFITSVNVIVEFSQYPFNFGYDGNFCINQDSTYQTFSGSVIEFNADLSRYYMLIAIELPSATKHLCSLVLPPILFTITINNILQSVIYATQQIQSNYGINSESGICSGINIETITASTSCSNGVVSEFILSPSGILIAFTTCNGARFVKVRVRSSTEFLSINVQPNIHLKILLSPLLSNLPSSTVFFNFNEQTNIYLKPLLSPLLPNSLISSEIWNNIVNDLYIVYNFYVNLFQNFENITIYNFFEFVKDTYDFINYPIPYQFTNLLVAKKGVPLTYNDFNALINAINQISQNAKLELKYKIEKVWQNQIVKASTFNLIIENLNYLLTYADYTFFNFSNTAQKFAGINTNASILNLIIQKLDYDVEFNGSSYIKNLVILRNNKTFILSGTSFIKNAIIGSTNTITLNNNAVIQNLYLHNIQATITLNNNAIIQNLYCNNATANITLNDNATIVNNYCTSS